MPEKFCRECGTELTKKELKNEGMIPFCPSCGEFRFPMYNAAVSMIVINEATGKILLIQQYGRQKNILVAGYINRGERAEDAVVREIREETGMNAYRISFNRSGFFEPSNTLMCNFTAYVRDDSELAPNEEIDSYGWFDPEEARKQIAKGSLAEFFLTSFLDENMEVNR